ncbi:uncharacterized protein LOC127867334 [Dreissena polymorpha]|uniref:Ig-like domain-containing protein n=1 Tax=Dreissena polymorpha TaxID=45954 RepID=A0A9D4LZ01_DREPO|nr:uncharacterized protein LOC127867334 [Dreissena polymorpha]KAH3866586.1 hypothetical protein DPMN_029683 [Dreissena polymorpha]
MFSTSRTVKSVIGKLSMILGALLTLPSASCEIDTNAEMICDISGIKEPQTVYFTHARTQLIEVQPAGKSCPTKIKEESPNIKCGCNHKKHAFCNISLRQNAHDCDSWMCSASIDGILKKSEFVQLCLGDDDSMQRKQPTVKCAGFLLKPNVTHWILEDWILKSNSDMIKIVKVGIHNISGTYLPRENNGSIVVCKLEEENQAKWVITIIYPFTARSFEHISNHTPTNRSCSTGNPTITGIIEEYLSTECPSIIINSTVNVTFCDAVNRDEMGARQFVGHMNGSFKLDILNPAAVRTFYIEEFRDYTNITLNESRRLTFICIGEGNPPPTLALVSKSLFVNTSHSQLQHTIEFSSSKGTDTYLCIAFNGIGNDSKSIYVDAFISTGEDGFFSSIIILCVGSCILLVIVVVCLLRSRGKICKIVHVTEAILEVDTVEAANRACRSSHNNDFNFEEDTSQNNTHNGVKSPTECALKTRGFCNETYSEYNPRKRKDYTMDGNDHKEKPEKTTSVSDAIRGFCNDAYADWTKPSTSWHGNAQQKFTGNIEHEQGDQRRQNPIELRVCTYGVVTRTRNQIDYDTKDSVSCKPNTTKRKEDCIYSMAKKLNDEDSAV